MTKIYTRICDKCHNPYKSPSRMSKICIDCARNKGLKLRLKDKYDIIKIQLDNLRSEETINKWKLLSEAYKIGKEIWGNEFSVKKLSEDMNLPYTTTKRCLSLDKATPKTWTLIRKGKISAFKAAQVCMTKNNKLQDETIDLIVKENYSTCKIKSWNIQSKEDLVFLRQQKAVEDGFSRKESAYRSLHNWIEKGKLLLLIKKEYLSENKLAELKKELLSIKNRIERFIGGLE
jgi:hypothetical protein